MATTKSKNGSEPDAVANAREATVVLGGREFVIHSLPMKASREWRTEFSQPVQQVLGVMRRMQDVELTDVSQAAQVLQQVGTYLLGSVDTLVEALFAYSPVLQAEREWIEAHADDTEAMAALWEVLKLAYPFGGLMQLFGRTQRMTGS